MKLTPEEQEFVEATRSCTEPGEALLIEIIDRLTTPTTEAPLTSDDVAVFDKALLRSVKIVAPVADTREALAKWFMDNFDRWNRVTEEFDPISYASARKHADALIASGLVGRGT